MANVTVTEEMEFEQNAKMRQIAERVTRAYPEVFGHIDVSRIAFLYELTGKPAKYGRNRTAAGVCIKPKSVFRDLLLMHGAEYWYIIAFFGEACEGRSLEWLQLLMYHELRHIGEDGKLVEHEIEGFLDEFDLAGTRWGYDQDLPDIVRKKISLVA